MTETLTFLTLILILRSAHKQLPPFLQCWNEFSSDELHQLHEVLSVPPGANAADDAVRPLILGDRKYPWHTVAVGLPMLVMDWKRYESRHASFSPAVVSTINLLNSRVVPTPSDSERASAVARFLDDVAAAVPSEGSASPERSPERSPLSDAHVVPFQQDVNDFSRTSHVIFLADQYVHVCLSLSLSLLLLHHAICAQIFTKIRFRIELTRVELDALTCFGIASAK